MANGSRSLSGAANAVLRWLDAGRSSIVVALALALVVPSVNVVTFDGLPLDNPWGVAAFAALLPFVFSASLRGALANALRQRVGWGHRALLIAAAAVVVVKLLLLVFGSDRGFVGCYSSTWRPPIDRCEASYSNLLQRHSGATRIDGQLDFGPSSEQASHLVTAYSTLVYTGGAASTNWNLSFSNDLRFNEAPGAGDSLHELMPFKAYWRGTAAIPNGGEVKVRYVGYGSMRIGGTLVPLPVSGRPGTVVAHVPSGNQPLQAKFGFADSASFAELRLLNRSGDPINAAAAPLPERLAAGLVWFILAVAFAGLALVALSALGSDLWLLGTIVVAALAAGLLSPSGQDQAFQYLAASLAPILVWRNPRRPILLAYGALLGVTATGLLNEVTDIHAVLYRASGTDFLTYESFARDIVLGHSLSGGEAVFYYQPGSRYLLGLLHLLFGDGDVLVTLWAMVGLSLPFTALIAWHRRRVRTPLTLAVMAIAGFLLLAVLNSPTVLSLVAMSASEVPSWALLPLAVAAPQLRPSRQGAWYGSAAAAALVWVMRNNQALAAAAILTAIVAAIGRRRRRILAGAVAVALAIALLPAVHNLAYGQRLVFSTTSMAPAQQISLSNLDQVFSNSFVGSQIRGHLSDILYDPPTPGLTHQSLQWLFWGLLSLWIAAVITALWRLRRRSFSLSGWLLLFLPIAYLAPHVIYQVESYYPRHIVAGYLAMGVSALGAFVEMSAGRGRPRTYSPSDRVRGFRSPFGTRPKAVTPKSG